MRLEKETSVFKRNALATAITNALGRATKFIAELSNGIFVHAEGTPSSPTDSNAAGVYITDQVDIIRNGQSVAEFKDTVRLGKTQDAYSMVLTPYTMDFNDKNNASVFEMLSRDYVEVEVKTTEEGVITPVSSMSTFTVPNDVVVDYVTVGSHSLEKYEEWWQTDNVVTLKDATTSRIEYSYTSSETTTELMYLPSPKMRIGKETGSSQVLIDYRSMQIKDKDGDVFFRAQDLRGMDGIYTATDTFVQGDYERASFYLTYPAVSDDYLINVLDANSNDVTNKFNITRTNSGIFFNPEGQMMWPPEGYTVIVTYDTTDDSAKILTFGEDSNGDPAFSVAGDGTVNTESVYKKNGLEFIKHYEYDLGVISISAGTPGTASGSLITVNLEYDLAGGYIPLSVNIKYVNTSVIGFNAFFGSNYKNLYVQVIRRYASAYAPGYHAYADVTFIKV